MGSSTIVNKSDEVRARLADLKAQRFVLQSRLSDFEAQRQHAESQLAGLKRDRDEILRGSADEKALTRVRKNCLEVSSMVEESSAGVQIIQADLTALAVEIRDAEAEYHAAGRKAWRLLKDELVARHRPELSEIFTKVWICMLEASKPAAIDFQQVLVELNPTLPRMDIPQGMAEFQRVKRELQAEVGLND